jgi:c-di-GMP-binding flagellar brake protein YcgR
LVEQENTKEFQIDTKVPCQVTFTVGERIFRGTSMHFSERGMLVMCRNPAPLNAKGKTSLVFPGFHNPIEMAAEVVWTNIHGVGDSLSPKGMGIKFLNLERDTERLLTQLATQYDSLSSIYACYYT